MKQLLRIFLGALTLAAQVQASDTLVEARDLQADAETARAGGAAIVVFFASDFCPYCHEVEELYLEPMQRHGQYAGRVLIRKVHVDRATTLVDFTGRRMGHDDFARREGTSLTPLVRFYAPDGRELANALRGMSSRDFYGGMLADAVEESILKLKRDAQGRASPLRGGETRTAASGTTPWMEEVGQRREQLPTMP
jgi:hypothetical protein